MKVCSNGLCHLTSMATMPIYGKNLQKSSKIFFSGTKKSMTFFFSGTKKSMTLTVGMQHRVLQNFQICSNDDPELTLTYFTARSNLNLMLLYGKKVKLELSEDLTIDPL